MGRNPNKGGEGSKMVGSEKIQTGVVCFQRYYCLSVFVCSIRTWEMSRLLTLKTT